MTELDEIVFVDDFYDDPVSVREQGLLMRYGVENWSVETYFPQGIQDRLADALQIKITEWPTTIGNGDFLYCTQFLGAKPIHTDGPKDSISVLIYLTPQELLPTTEFETYGTHFWRHKLFGFEHTPTCKELGRKKLNGRRLTRRRWNDFFERDREHLDRWEARDVVPYRFNRLIAFPGSLYHSSGEGFGTNVTTARLLHSYLLRARNVRQ